MNNKEIPLQFNLVELYQGCFEKINQTLVEGNKLWYGVIRLIITLASSFLLLSLALVDKLFKIGDSIQIPRLLIYGWIFLLITIILSIVQEIEGAIFYSRLGVDIESKQIEYSERISKGETHIVIDRNRKTIVYPNIWWGIFAINFFIISVIYIALAFLMKTLPGIEKFNGWILLGLFIVLLIIDLIFLNEFNKLKK